MPIRQTIREHLDASEDPNPHAVVDAVVASIPDADLRPVLTECVHAIVAAVAGTMRRDPAAPPTDSSSKGGAIRQADPSGAPPRPSMKSAYIRLLATRLAVGAGWKRLADCTKDDLLQAAAEREAQAAGNLAWASRYRRLAQSMSTSDTVSALPSGLVTDLLT